MAELISSYSTFADWATDAADAVREKTESTEKIKPCNLPEAIRGIEVGARGDIYWLSISDVGTISFRTDEALSSFVFGLGLGSYCQVNSVYFTRDTCPRIPSSVYILSVTGTCKVIPANCFYYCRFETIQFPECETIETDAFTYCRGMRSISFPACRLIKMRAFSTCTAINSIEFPMVETIGKYAFSNCAAIKSVDLPNCKTIGDSAFYSCSSISTINLPKVETIGESVFYFRSGISHSLSFPMCVSVGSNAFNACSNITGLYLPKCKAIGHGAFGTCYKMSTVTLGDCETIENYAFAYAGSGFDSGIKSLYMNGSSVPALGGASAFHGQNRISIYVPASLLTEYQTATNWTSLSRNMVGV